MFSARLERLRQFNRLAVLAAATLLAVGIALIAVGAVRALNMLEAAEVDRAPIIIGVLVALGVLVVLCLIVYAARVATIVHTMVHDGGRTRSLLTQLGLRASLRFVSSGRIGRMPGVVVISPPLLWFQMDTQTGPRFLPRFKKFPEHMRDLQFPRWWEEEIIFQSNNSAPAFHGGGLYFLCATKMEVATSGR